MNFGYKEEKKNRPTLVRLRNTYYYIISIAFRYKKRERLKTAPFLKQT